MVIRASVCAAVSGSVEAFRKSVADAPPLASLPAIQCFRDVRSTLTGGACHGRKHVLAGFTKGIAEIELRLSSCAACVTSLASWSVVRPLSPIARATCRVAKPCGLILAMMFEMKGDAAASTAGAAAPSTPPTIAPPTGP